MIFACPSTTFTALCEGAATGLAGTIGVRIENTDGTNHTARTTAGIVELEANSGIYAKRDMLAPSTRGRYVVIWDTGGGSPQFSSEELEVTSTSPASAAGAFAAVEDVAVRLGRELTESQEAQAESAIALVTALIADAVDRDSDWAAELDPVPGALKELCVAKAASVVLNPAIGIVASESLGQHSVTFARSSDSGLMLSDAEGRLARLAVYGTNAASAQPRSAFDRIIDLREGRDVDEEPVQ